MKCCGIILSGTLIRGTGLGLHEKSPRRNVTYGGGKVGVVEARLESSSHSIWRLRGLQRKSMIAETNASRAMTPRIQLHLSDDEVLFSVPRTKV